MIEKLVLGTAKWGSEISRKVAFDLLDHFSAAGGRFIDAATNYPIDGIHENYGLANKFISEWIALNSGTNIEIFIKIGSKNNSGSSDHDLSAKSLEKQIELLQDRFGSNLVGLGVHWDNRGNCLVEEIRETTEFFGNLHKKGFRIGISGVQNKEAYSETAPDLADIWEIQVKETHMNREIRDSYIKYFPEAKYLAYGINGEFASVRKNHEEGLLFKINAQIVFSKRHNYKKSLTSILQLGEIQKVIIGPRKTEQLKSVLKWTK
jgi:aryl-alcohol dehydrogenase-like predicted oxidoreductase